MPINIPDGADSKKFSPVNISLVNKPTFVTVFCSLLNVALPYVAGIPNSRS